MSEMERSAPDFIGYEYKELFVNSGHASMYIDCYQNFGWVVDENILYTKETRQSKIKLKRDRKIINKAELTRLQRHFEACGKEIAIFEKSKYSAAAIYAITTGVIGTAFMAASTFAITNTPPLVLLCIILAVPGFLGWILPYFIYHRILRRKTELVNPLIEQKYDEIYEICEKGKQLIIK